jgi:hypothetical protein
MNWDYELVEFANNRIGTSFERGTNDCVALVRKAWEIVTGEDVLGDKIPDYTTDIGAVRAFKKVGSFEEVLDGIGATTLPLNFATYGDIIFVKKEHNEEPFQNVAIVVGNNVLIASEDHGVILTVRLTEWMLSLDCEDKYIAYRAP